MWTFIDDLTILPNLIIRSNFKDGIFKWYELYPVNDYVLRVPNLDEFQINENGEYIFNEDGKKILLTPYRSYGGAMVLPGYDWEKNPNEYQAEPYEEGMIVFGKPEDRPEFDI